MEIYRDDELLVFKGVRSISEIIIWRDKLQEKVDKISVNYFLPYICESWNSGGRQSRKSEKPPQW